MNLKKSRQLINSRTPCMWKSCVVYIERIRRSPQIQALCEVYEFHTNRQTGQEKADYEWHRSVSSIASGMRKHIRIELTFFIQQHREKPKGRLFSELLEDECPFLLFKAKEKIKNGKEQELQKQIIWVKKKSELLLKNAPTVDFQVFLERKQ